jgi:hypothetical protein
MGLMVRQKHQLIAVQLIGMTSVFQKTTAGKNTKDLAVLGRAIAFHLKKIGQASLDSRPMHPVQVRIQIRQEGRNIIVIMEIGIAIAAENIGKRRFVYIFHGSSLLSKGEKRKTHRGRNPCALFTQT